MHDEVERRCLPLITKTWERRRLPVRRRDGRDRRPPGHRARGTSVMRAAALAGVQVPKLCATDTLKAFGSCRLCLVEIEGRKGYPASCTTTVAAGMKIATQSPKLTQLRRGVIDLYVSDHPLECETCPPNTHCELQDMAADVGITQTSYAPGRDASPAAAGHQQSLLRFRSRSCASCARAACARAMKCRARSRSPSRAAASIRRSRRARTSRSWIPSASRAAPASRAARPAR